MAAVYNPGEGIFENHVLFTSMEGNIAQILRKCSSVSSTDIIEKLFDDIDKEDIEILKDALFE